MKTKALARLMSYIERTEAYFEHFYVQRRRLFWIIAGSVVALWQWPLIFSFGFTGTGDFDYFAQAYEAVRISILDHHQFPWNNAWVGGGVPLYANPQVGVFSIQTLLVLIFGTVTGLKISLLIYTQIGFWSMLLLARKVFKASTLISLGLALIWITNGFFVAHAIGHYTFALFQLFPLLLYLVVTIKQRLHWLYLGVVAALIVLSSFHYAAIQSLAIVACIAVYLAVRDRKNIKQYTLAYAGSAFVFLALSVHRIAYASDYAFDFPRIFKEQAYDLSVILRAFVIPVDQSKWYYDILPGTTKEDVEPYAWGEFNAFVGYGFALAFLLSLGLTAWLLFKRRQSTRVKRRAGLLLLALTPIFFVIVARGAFDPNSPYAFIHDLPAFSGMRVSSRWLIWSVFFALIFVSVVYARAASQKMKAILTLLVVIGAVEVYLVGLPSNPFTMRVQDFRDPNASFQQFSNFDNKNPPKDFQNYKPRKSLKRAYELYSYESTINGYGEARGYEPLVDTRFAPTLRCGINEGCAFVRSSNAKVVSWSPNKIVLERTDNRPIFLNMNPSNYWLINGNRQYNRYKVAEVLEPFVITDQRKTIVLEVSPRSLPSIVKNQVKKKLTSL